MKKITPEENVEPKSAQKQQKRFGCKNCNNFKSWYQDEANKHYDLCVQKNKNDGTSSHDDNFNNANPSKQTYLGQP